MLNCCVALVRRGLLLNCRVVLAGGGLLVNSCIEFIGEAGRLVANLCSDVQVEGDAQNITAHNCRGLCDFYTCNCDIYTHCMH